MGKMIYAGEKCKNPKKKPGWQTAAQQEAEWLKSINGMSLFSTSKYKPKVAPKTKVSPVVDGGLVGADRPVGAKSLGSFGGVGTKKVHRPEIMYKGDDEMLARELKARERKFNAAPAYNKSGDVFVTEEELSNQLKGNKRRS